jgi:DNA-binding transcriptional regulator YdaS (Cro superfamily)
MIDLQEPPASDMEALDKAIKTAGGVGALADRIGVAASLPSMWRKRGSVPAEHCPAIERETGVKCELLNPRVAWDVLRAQASEQGA